MADDPAPPATPVVARALGHPLRFAIFELLQNAVHSPSELHRTIRTHTTVSLVWHHVNKLEQAGLVCLVRTRSVRGAKEHFYTAVWDVEIKISDARARDGVLSPT